MEYSISLFYMLLIKIPRMDPQVRDAGQHAQRTNAIQTPPRRGRWRGAHLNSLPLPVCNLKFPPRGVVFNNGSNGGKFSYAGMSTT